MGSNYHFTPGLNKQDRLYYRQELIPSLLQRTRASGDPSCELNDPRIRQLGPVMASIRQLD